MLAYRYKTSNWRNSRIEENETQTNKVTGVGHVTMVKDICNKFYTQQKEIYNSLSNSRNGSFLGYIWLSPLLLLVEPRQHCI